MGDFNYESYCGLYCGACSILKAYQTGQKDKFALFWAGEAGLELKCHGCKTDQVFAGCSMCKMRECAIGKKVERCLECSDFPCSQFNMEEHKYISSKLPHLKTIVDNLAVIGNIGVDQWLEDQGKLWKCPECQTEYTWYADYCIKCGKDLKEIKGFKNEFDSSIFGLKK